MVQIEESVVVGVAKKGVSSKKVTSAET